MLRKEDLWLQDSLSHTWTSRREVVAFADSLSALTKKRLLNNRKASSVTFSDCLLPNPVSQSRQPTCPGLLQYSRCYCFRPRLSFSDSAAAKSLQSCPTLQPYRRKPTRPRRPWDSPGKNPGVGCHFLLQCMKVKSESEVAQSCPTLGDPMDCSLPGSSIHGIFQARVLEWGAIAFSVQ